MILNTQPVEPVIKDAASIAVHSIFATIQGEGPFAGCRAIFVRLAGCNLQCPMCDTEYTSVRVTYGPATLLDELKDLTYPIPELVVITGGEPFRQPIRPVVEALLVKGFRVQIETNGTLYRDLPWDHPRLFVVCSPKMHIVHPKLVPHLSALKYVGTAASLDPADGLPNSALDHPIKPGHKLFRPPQHWDRDVFLQPVDEADPEANDRNLKAIIGSCRKHGYRLCLQVHKIIGLA